jgi:GNAT superfamily N-acetyltransferase
MGHFHLVEKANLALCYDIDSARYSAAEVARMGVSKALFCELFQDVPTLGFAYDDRPIGGCTLYQGGFHIAVLPEFHGRWSVLWPATLEWLFALQDPVEVKPEKFNPRAIAFFRRHGFPQVREDDGHVYFEMSRQHARILTRDDAATPALSASP